MESKESIEVRRSEREVERYMEEGQIGCAEIAQEERVRTLELRGWMNFAKRGVIVFELGG